MTRLPLIVAATLLLTACGSDEIVHSTGAAPDNGPLYCYKSLSDITCYSAAYDRDRRRLTGFVGVPPKDEDPAGAVTAPPPILYSPASK